MSEAKKGKEYIIKKVITNTVDTFRLIEYGFVIGTHLEIVRMSLGKKLCLIKLRGYLLSVRRDELKNFEVEECAV